MALLFVMDLNRISLLDGCEDRMKRPVNVELPGGILAMGASDGGKNNVSGDRVASGEGRNFARIAAVDRCGSKKEGIDAGDVVIEQLMENRRLLDAFLSAHKVLCGMRNGGKAAAAALDIKGDKALPVTIGDSLIFAFNDAGEFTFMSRERNLPMDCYRSGTKTYDEAINNKHSNVVTSWLGESYSPEDRRPEMYSPFDLNVGDTVVACSDFLTAALRPEEVVNFIAGKTPEEAVKTIGELVDKRIAGEGLENRLWQLLEPKKDHRSLAVYVHGAELVAPNFDADFTPTWKGARVVISRGDEDVAVECTVEVQEGTPERVWNMPYMKNGQHGVYTGDVNADMSFEPRPFAALVPHGKGRWFSPRHKALIFEGHFEGGEPLE